MSRLSEIELNKEKYQFHLDPMLPKTVTYCIIALWILVIGQWIWFFWGKKTPFDVWLFGVYIFITFLVAGLTLLHWYRLKHNYNFTKNIAKRDFRKALAKKTIGKG
ncbi:hypothetical protein [Thiovibrio frasassiensis]|uniref:Uncharacterized protein n=1 Tax=Thiovibrio frasassiensis TaxID=2984131 RepID=A0A9X4ME37_9BACT|nr:hypothetical protein [Thiovibrio frasassiensis]MDG4475606.1 hypothetical protein [Thiovibrio frasassiensis]